VADLGVGAGGDRPPNFEKKQNHTRSYGFSIKKKYTLALLVFFIKFSPFKKILDPPLR
jgi:hypothetical protein